MADLMKHLYRWLTCTEYRIKTIDYAAWRSHMDRTDCTCIEHLEQHLRRVCDLCQ